MENIKKIVLKFKSGYITELESDTTISYVFAHDFENLKDIYYDFKDGNLPFVITNAYDAGYIIRPFYITDDGKNENNELKDDIEQEADRKKIKKLSNIIIDIEILKYQFKDKEKNQSEQKEYKDKLLILYYNNEEEKTKKQTISEFKNFIPRFNGIDTTPFSIENINYTDNEKVIYVKIYNQEKYNRFFESFKNIFETIGWGKGKSRGYGNVDYVKEQNLNEKEKEKFEYIEELKKENKYIVLNNYKPSKQDLENIDIDKSFIVLNHKHTKSLNNMPFKGKMSFISAGSVISGKNIKGDFYNVKLEDNKESTNFGYLF